MAGYIKLKTRQGMTTGCLGTIGKQTKGRKGVETGQEQEQNHTT